MESNVNLEKMIMSLGKDNTDFYVDFDTIADWVETKQVKNLSDFKALIESKGLVITYELSRALYNVIGNIDLLYDDKVILKNFRHKKNLANNENLKKLNNFLDNQIYLLKNKKKKEGNDTIENLKKAIDTKDKIKIGNIFAYQKYQNQYKHMAKLINNNIKVIQEDEIYDILNRSNSVEEFCCNTTMNLINRISVAKFTEGRIIELDETAFGMIEKNYLDIDNKIILLCGLDLNPKYDEIMTKKKKKYGSTNDPVYTLLELFAYMKPEEYRDMYNQVNNLVNQKNINKITLKPMVPETENLTDPLSDVKQITRTLAFPIFSQKPLSLTTKPGRYIPVTSVQQSVDATTDVDKAIEISNNVSKTFGCGCHRDKTGNDLEEIIIDSLINDINHDLLDIVLYYFDLTKDQREIVETINNISPEQEGNFRRFDNREFIDFVERALKIEMTPFTIFTIKFDLFVKSNSQNYQDVINHIFVDNPLVFPGCADVEAFLIDYTKLITNDLKLVKLPYGIFKNMVKEIEGKPYLSAYLELTKLMVPDKTHLIDEMLSEIDNLKENDIFINMVNQCNDFDDLFEKYKLFSNSVAIVLVGFNGKEFLFKEIPVERRPAKTIHLQKADRQKSQSTKALEISKEKGDPTYLALKESLDKTKKEANINYIKLIVSKYNGAIEKTTDDKVLLDFAFGENRRTVMTAFKTVFEKDTFLQKLIEWSKDNYREIYNIFENIIITNNKLEITLLDKDPAIISTNILLLYSYIFELYKRIGYFDIDCSLFKNYKNFILQLDMNINLRTSEEFLNAFEKAYEKYLDENLK